MTEAPTTATVPPRTPRCWTVCAVEGSVDLQIVASDVDPLGAVLPGIARALGIDVPGLWSGSSRLADDLPLSAPELGHGALLGLGRPGPRTRAEARSSALELHVVGGPEAGRTLSLGQGSHLLGRGAEATIRLDDPDVSRRHAILHVGGGRLTVADLGSTNGSRLDGADLDDRPSGWPGGAVLRTGGSALAVRGPDGCPAAVEPGAGGRTRLRPAPRMPPQRPEVEVEFPRPPMAPPRRRLAWIAVALPAVAGLGMAWLLHTPQFLFFGLLSPVVALGTWWSERWTGRRDGRRDAAAHAVALLDADARLSSALRADRRAAEEAWPDLATLTTAARRRSGRLWERRRGDPDALGVRVGTGRAATGVTRLEADGSRVRQCGEDLPVVVDLRAGGLGVTGPRPRTTGVLAAAVAQLAALHAPGEVDLVVLAESDRLAEWSWLRWLPHLRAGGVRIRPAGGSRPAAPSSEDEVYRWVVAEMALRRAQLGDRHDAGSGPGIQGWLTVLVDGELDPRSSAILRGARDVGVVVLTAAESAEHLPVATDTVLRLAGETGDTAVLVRAGHPDHPAVVVDRLPRASAEAFARDLAALAPTGTVQVLPRQVRLLDLRDDGLGFTAAGALEGSWNRARNCLVATLGRTADGPVRIDLCRDGPHALVAGTTGAGKSELLQTLIASLALHHPPDRCSFLLVDYKGGAAFAEAVHLPHTVGLVTDLDGQTTERALRSLSAELTRREALLAAHRAVDVAALPSGVDLARLVIVVDEFATLAEELPAFVPGLVGIAQRGRSLGVHLVLATQRPSGVVSPEIRANCTLRICLRTTDDADSRDVIGTGAAAHLPVDLPGRAFVRTGSATPVEVQVARVSATPPSADPRPDVRRWSWPHALPRVAAMPEPGDTDLARLAQALGRQAATTGAGTPHRPWRPQLPVRLRASDLDATVSAAPVGSERLRLRIGLVDRPDAQAQEPLEIDLGEAGGWLAVGGSRSGRTTLLRTVLGEAVAQLGPDEVHVHVLDAGGGAFACEAATLPHTGTTVGGDDALRTVRLLDRLTEEIAARRAGGRSGNRPLLLLLVDGVEAVSAQLDEADPGRGSAALLRLVRDGAAAGLTCVLTADRAVPGGRLAATADHRLVLPLPERADYAVAGIPVRAVPERRPPGRALLGETALECQLALPRPLPPASAAGRNQPPGTAGPVRIVELPRDPDLALPPRPAHDVAGRSALLLPVGPGGDEGTPVCVDLGRTGGLLVAGPPGSGRSSALAAFAAHLHAMDVPVLRLGRCAGATAVPVSATEIDTGDPADTERALAAWLTEHAGATSAVLVDDVGNLGESPLLTRLPVPGGGDGPVLIAAGTAADLARCFHGPVAALRRGHTGLLLRPGPGDADVLGVRLPRTPVPGRPGSGWLVVSGTVTRVQVARRRTGTG